MSGIKTTVTRQSNRQRVDRNYVKAAQRAVKLSAVMVHGTAVQSITDGNKSGETYTKYNPRRTHRASAAGEPPAADTGYLHNNIIFDIDADGFGASVERRAEYSEALEFGTSKMQARPFLQPAVEENRPKIRALITQMMRGAN